LETDPVTVSNAAKATHDAAIADQFTRQAAQFAASAVHHNQAALDLLVKAARPGAGDVSLDIACGPGSVVAAFARHVRRAEGLDATEAMLTEARKLTLREGLGNVAWHLGDVCALPFPAAAFDIVSCRYAFHHLLEPARALAEMVRVCRHGGRIVLCDAVASDDPTKAAAFNAMERHRDPSTVEFRTLDGLRGLFVDAGLREPEEHFYKVPAELERLIGMAYPKNDDREGLRAMVEAAVDHDAMGVGARREGGTIRFEYPAVVFAAVKRD
jgi:ubiquinone/menaquinone biosynthesis C-methylase UbiE